MMDFDDFFTMDKCRLDRLDLEEKKITASHNACMFHLTFWWLLPRRTVRFSAFTATDASKTFGFLVRQLSKI